jgi:AraC-like DNA-binding protein
MTVCLNAVMNVQNKTPINPASQGYQAKIAVQAVRSFVNFAERQGLPRAQLLNIANLVEEQLHDSHLLIDVSRFEDLVGYASKALDDALLGFIHGQVFEPDRWGVLGLIALTSANMEGALQAQYRFQSLSGNMGAPIHMLGEQAEGGLDPSICVQWVPAYNCSHHTCEMIVTGLIALGRQLLNDLNYSPLQVYFTHSSHASSGVYEEYFNCPVTFNAQYNGLVLPSGLLGAPLRRFDKELNSLLVERAEGLLARQTSQSPIEVIKDYVIKTLPDHVPDMDEIALYLNLSVRSTQRKLHDYGTSYSQLLDVIRKELALTYLRQTSNSVLYVSERLGFSEQSAFQRAFKRWTGLTPRGYRIKTQQQDS